MRPSLEFIKDCIPVFLPLFLRAGLALVALVVVKLSYNILDPAGFQVFNLLMFCFAIAGSIGSSINREFWANNNRAVFAYAVFSSTVVGVLVLTVVASLDAVLEIVPENYDSFAMIGAGSIYILSRVVERFSYGQIMLEKSVFLSFAVTFGFSAAELAILVTQGWFDNASLSLRVIGPSLLFACIFWAVPATRELSRDILAAVPRWGKAAHWMRKCFLDQAGKLTIAVYLMITVALMSDRFVVVAIDGLSDGFKADYLLVLSYAVALHTLLNVLIDVARRNVFSNGVWQADSGRFVAASVVGVGFLCGAALVSLPALHLAKIVPESVGAVLWSFFVGKAGAIFLVSFCSVDKIQRGELGGLLGQMTILAILNGVFVTGFLRGLPIAICVLLYAIPVAVLAGRSVFLMSVRMRAEGVRVGAT